MAKTNNTGAAQVAPSRRAAPVIPASEEILVHNGYYGALTYKSKRNGIPLMFKEFGDSDYIQFGELQTMRSTQPKFFSENWILIDDQEVIDALGVGRYYENALTLADFDTIFDRPIKELKAIVPKLSKSQKQVLFAMAKDRIERGEIDSKRKVQALEELFGVPFEEA